MTRCAISRAASRGIASSPPDRAQFCRFCPSRSRVAPAREQQFNDPGMTVIGRDHQGSAAAIVDCIDVGAAVEQQVDHGLGIERACAFGIARCPHQRCQIVAVACVDVDLASSSRRTTGVKPRAAA